MWGVGGREGLEPGIKGECYVLHSFAQHASARGTPDVQRDRGRQSGHMVEPKRWHVQHLARL